METLTTITDEQYQILTRQAARDGRWAAYFLIVNACYEAVKQVPTTSQECEQVDVDQLLCRALEHLGQAIEDVLPRGIEEFTEYIPTYAQRRHIAFLKHRQRQSR